MPAEDGSNDQPSHTKRAKTSGNNSTTYIEGLFGLFSLERSNGVDVCLFVVEAIQFYFEFHTKQWGNIFWKTGEEQMKGNCIAFSMTMTIESKQNKRSVMQK